MHQKHGSSHSGRAELHRAATLAPAVCWEPRCAHVVACRASRLLVQCLTEDLFLVVAHANPSAGALAPCDEQVMLVKLKQLRELCTELI